MFKLSVVLISFFSFASVFAQGQAQKQSPSPDLTYERRSGPSLPRYSSFTRCSIFLASGTEGTKVVILKGVGGIPDASKTSEATFTTPSFSNAEEVRSAALDVPDYPTENGEGRRAPGSGTEVFMAGNTILLSQAGNAILEKNTAPEMMDLVLWMQINCGLQSTPSPTPHPMPAPSAHPPIIASRGHPPIIMTEPAPPPGAFLYFTGNDGSLSPLVHVRCLILPGNRIQPAAVEYDKDGPGIESVSIQKPLGFYTEKLPNLGAVKAAAKATAAYSVRNEGAPTPGWVPGHYHAGSAEIMVKVGNMVLQRNLSPMTEELVQFVDLNCGFIQRVGNGEVSPPAAPVLTYHQNNGFFAPPGKKHSVDCAILPGNRVSEERVRVTTFANGQASTVIRPIAYSSMAPSMASVKELISQSEKFPIETVGQGPQDAGGISYSAGDRLLQVQQGLTIVKKNQSNAAELLVKFTEMNCNPPKPWECMTEAQAKQSP
jgi:hypothetical protein